MTPQDIEILLQYLYKVIVPQADVDRFLVAVQRLQSLRDKQKQAA